MLWRKSSQGREGTLFFHWSTMCQCSQKLISPQDGAARQAPSAAVLTRLPSCMGANSQMFCFRTQRKFSQLYSLFWTKANEEIQNFLCYRSPSFTVDSVTEFVWLNITAKQPEKFLCGILNFFGRLLVIVISSLFEQPHIWAMFLHMILSLSCRKYWI